MTSIITSMHNGTSLHQQFFFSSVVRCKYVIFFVLHLHVVIIGFIILVNSSVSTGLGQLLVWEWQSESYVLKQQGHFNSMVSLAYSPDGQYIVTGGEDGKVSETVVLKYDFKF